MKFVNLYALNLLWALIGVFVIMVYGIAKRKKVLLAFADANMFPSVVPGFNQKRRWIKAMLMIFAFAFGIVALAGPQMGYKWEKTTQKGVDIMIALDCSKSMLARDIRPNRLERAKREIIDLLRMMRSDRAGLVAFSGNAFLQCPLTLDHDAFHIFLNALEPGFLPVGGTNLDAAIQTSWEGFEKESDTQKAIIVITDGESTVGVAEETARKMAGLGIKIFTIGVGNLQGAPIPDEDGGFKKDASGNIILSRVDEKGLEHLAALTGGTYVRSVAGDMDLDLIYTDKILGSMEKKTLTSGRKKVWENRYQWFLFPCLILLFMELMVPSKKQNNFLGSVVIAFGIFLFVSPIEPVQAKMVSSSVKEGIKVYNEQAYEKAKGHFIDAQLEDPENAALYYNIGAAAYKNQEYELALENFLQAANTKDKKMRNDALYNLANTYYRMGRLDEAIKGYETLLNDFPEDVQAKENLEFVKQKEKEQKENQSKSDQDNKNSENKDPENKEKDKKEKDKDSGRDPEQNKGQDKDNESNKDDKSDPKNAQNKQQSKKEDNDDQGMDPGENTAQPEEQETGAKQAEEKDRAGRQGETSIDTNNQQAQKQMEKMLNRLEDKPGRAMMPVTGEQHVEKDW